MSDTTVSAYRLPGGKGELFLLVRRPRHISRCVLVVPPFAEEMNKCRRMVTETALRLAAEGSAVLVPDLFGTGDSDGDFAEARWSVWEDDLARVCAWSSHQGAPVTSILAIRLGAALALSAVSAGRIVEAPSAVLWQPVFDGGRHLTQFLRLRTAAGALAEARRERVTELRARLAAGETLEVGGYPVEGGLAADLDALVPPRELPKPFESIHWMEVIRDPEEGIAESSRRLIGHDEQSAGHVFVRTFTGEPFWATVEVACLDEMVRATVGALCGASI
ncbi:MAG: hydrolase 2, exosortase A system-associated [Steroidobacteraceae bacterium]